jgi:hypothetical protein
MCQKAIELAKPKAVPESSEQTEAEKLAAEAKVKADADAVVASQDSILSNVSLQTSRVMNL